WERGSAPEGGGDDEGQEDLSEGPEEGSDSGEASSDSAGDIGTPVETLADLVPGGKEEEASMEQRLGEAVLARAGDSFQHFQPRQLSRLCWALGAWHGRGSVKLPGSDVFAARSLSEAGQHPKEYTAEELAQVLWAFATLVGKADSPAQELAGLVGA
ncbi:unnamed protein product, partial [Ectocarpus fasciculatus]